MQEKFTLEKLQAVDEDFVSIKGFFWLPSAQGSKTMLPMDLLCAKEKCK